VGEYAGEKSTISDANTHVQYLDVTIKPNAEFSNNINSGFQGFIYVFEGEAIIGGTKLQQHNFAVLDEGDNVRVEAGDTGTRMIMVSGMPINEPIVQYGPFVMNTQDEIKQAFQDYQNGKLVRGKASFVTA